MPVSVPSRQSHEALGNIARRNIAKYGSSPSLYELLCSVTFEKSPFFASCKDCTHCIVSHRKLFQGHCAMTRDNTYTKANGVFKQDILPVTHEQPTRLQEPVNNNKPKLVWNWELEHADRKKEAKADSAIHGTPPFQVDRKLLKDIVNEKMGTEVARINYLGAGTFHKGYLITLVDSREVVARVARRFMPRLKTESEVATMRYLRERTNIPVPIVYHYDANPYNRLGGEYILMSKAQGVPLSRVFHSMAHPELMGLMQNLALMLLPLFALRFPRIGSLYLGPDSEPIADSSTAATPTAMSRTLSMTPVKHQYALVPQSEFHVGPIVSWPFFGSNRGDLVHPTEINRGPWSSTHSYLQSCVDREVKGVMLENEGKTAPHRLHLDPDEIISSRHHKVQALSGDVSDQSDEWDWEESEAEWDGPGNRMYEDYRRMQRTTFLVAHLRQREEKVKEEMNRFVKIVERLGTALREQGDGDGSGTEEFTLDCHDLNLENVFVDEHDPSQITCIIDWESTTTRPLWAAAHVPAFLQTSPFTSKLFRATIEKISKQPRSVMVGGQIRDLSLIATEWLHHEASGTRLRMAHRCVEWDGWEEGLVTSILGPEEQEEDWFKSWDDANPTDSAPDYPDTPQSPSASTSPTLTESVSDGEDNAKRLSGGVVSKTKNRTANQLPLKVVAVEKEKEKLLNSTGDYCGGRGGELGRRLEAWLCVNGDSEGRVELAKKWDGHVEEGL